MVGMEREMSDAPERIWAERSDMGRQQWRSHNDYGGTEYTRADIAEAEVAKLRRHLQAIQNAPKFHRGDWYEMVEWMCAHARTALVGSEVSHAPEVMGHFDDETPQNKASENDGGRSGGHSTIA